MDTKGLLEQLRNRVNFWQAQHQICKDKESLFSFLEARHCYAMVRSAIESGDDVETS